MTIERWTDERLDQLASMVAQIAGAVNENRSQIAENSRQIAENGQQIAENGRQIDNLRISVTELREGQAILTQMFVQEREAMQDFRRTTNAALDRIDRTLDYLMRERG